MSFYSLFGHHQERIFMNGMRMTTSCLSRMFVVFPLYRLKLQTIYKSLRGQILCVCSMWNISISFRQIQILQSSIILHFLKIYFLNIRTLCKVLNTMHVKFALEFSLHLSEWFAKIKRIIKYYRPKQLTCINLQNVGWNASAR